MEVKELLSVLKEAGLKDEEIKVLLEECLKELEPKQDIVPPVEKEESEDEKMNRVFGEF